MLSGEDSGSKLVDELTAFPVYDSSNRTRYKLTSELKTEVTGLLKTNAEHV